MAEIVYESSINHSGIRGMKWGIRRFQNPDGSLTAAGRRRYGSGEQRYSGTAPQAKPQATNQNGETKPVSTEKLPPNKQGLPESRSARHKSISDMTDDELNSVINRLSKESEYRKLTYKPTAMQKAGRYLKDIAKKPMHDLGEQVLAIGMETVANKAIKSLGGTATIKLTKGKDGDKKQSDGKQIGKEVFDSFMAAANEANKPKKPKK